MIQIKSKKQGGELTSILFNGEEKLHDGIIVWNRQSPILFPMVGRLKEDKTIIEGEEYEMKQHGFARDLEFEEVCNTEEKQEYILMSNEETKKKYPYDFEFKVTYTKTDDSVTTKYTVANKGSSSMIFGVGAHPAYKVDYQNSYIEFEKEEKDVKFYGVENGLVGEAYKKEVEGNKRIYLEENSFENDAIIMEGLKSNKVYIKNKKDNKEVLEFDFTGFPFLAIWSKKDAPFLCLEPWHTTADTIYSKGEFKDKKGILKLEPNEEFECEYKVRFY